MSDERGYRLAADMFEARQDNNFDAPFTGMKLARLSPFPANSNPFHHDLYHMGQYIGTNVCIMGESMIEDSRCNYLIIFNKETGERLRIQF